MKDRYRRIFQNLPDDVDVVAIVNGMKTDANFFYITGYTSGLFELSHCYLFRDGHVEVITSPLEEQAARLKQHQVHIFRSAGEPSLESLVKKVLGEARKIGINFRAITHQDYLALAKMVGRRKIVDASQALDMARRVKDEDELKAIKKACDIISRVADKVPELLREGMTESQLRADIEYEIMRRGASPSFESIVAFGENSALPHYSAGGRKLNKGDTVLVDIGARYNLYCSDLTRTYFFMQSSDEQKEMYRVVREAQEKSIQAIREGVRGMDVHAVAAKIIDSSKFSGRFIHSLGHHLGIEVHDGFGRALAPHGKDKLQCNMVLTVEPGVYLPGKGGVRIEDDVAVTSGGCKILTHADKELRIVG